MNRAGASAASPRERDLAERLSTLVRIATVTPPDDGPLAPEVALTFTHLQEQLREFFPHVFSTVRFEAVGRAGLLGHLEGSGNAGAQGAVVLMAHQDVVPAPTGDGAGGWHSAGWSHPPFAGVVAEGSDGLTIYGRGTLDDKGSLLVLCEALEGSLASGWLPQRDLYLLFGADEEAEGPSAVAAVEVLRERGVNPWLVLDEGGAVVSGAIPGMRAPMAAIGVAEKGVVSLEIVAQADPTQPAHASTPPRRSAVATLARALTALERHPHPAVVDEVTVAMLNAVAPHVRPPLRSVLSRAGKLRGVLAAVVPNLGAELAAMLRTTMALTQLQGSSAPNVIASSARGVVNMRVATTSSVAEAVAHVERVVSRAVGKTRGVKVKVRVMAATEPTPASPSGEERWALLTEALAAAYPDAVPVPYTMLAASDSRHIAPIAQATYRFSPLAMSAAQRASIHGVDEHVSAASLVAGVQFYTTLLERI